MKGLKYNNTNTNGRNEIAVIYKGYIILYLYIRQDNYGFYILGGHENEYRNDKGDYLRFVTEAKAIEKIKSIDYTVVKTSTKVPFIKLGDIVTKIQPGYFTHCIGEVIAEHGSILQIKWYKDQNGQLFKDPTGNTTTYSECEEVYHLKVSKKK